MNSHTGSSTTILIIDDNEANRYATSRMLCQAGYQAVQAACGAEGLRLACAVPQPDLILLDVHLPDLNGFEVCRRLKADPATTAIPVVHLTAERVDEEYQVEGLESGALAYLVRPVSPRELLAQVRAALRIGRTERELRQAAELNRRIIDASQDSISVLDLEGNLVSMSPGGQKLREIEDIQPYLGRSWVEFWPEADRPRVAEALATARAGGVGRFQAFCPSTQGRPMWWDVSISPIPGGDGWPERLLAVSRDVTGQHWAEDALRESETRLRTLSDATFEGICTSRQGIIEDCNEQFARMLGYARGELIGRPIAEYLPEEVRSAVLDNIRAGRESEIEHKMLRKDGSRVTVEAHGRTVETTGGRIRISVIRDVTERRRAEDTLRASEERMKQAVNVASLGFFDHDHVTGALYWSPMMRQINDWPEDQPPDLDVLIRRIHPEDRETFAAAVRQAHDPAGCGAFQQEYRVLRRNGSVCWISVRSQTFFEGDAGARRPVRTVGAELEITERKWAELALRESEAKYRSLFENSMDAILLTIPDGRITAANPAACAMFGMTEEELCRVGRQAIADPDDPRWAFALGERTCTGTLKCELCYRRKDGIRFTGEVSSVILAGNEPKCFVIIRDITERKRMEDELRQHAVDLAAADRRKDEFMAMLAHELRNPLAPVRNAVQILQLVGSGDQTLQRQRAIIERQVGHMARLLDDLLDVSRITRGKVTLHCQALYLKDVLLHAAEMARPLIEARRHTLEFAAPPDDLQVDADIDRLAQIVGNLLANAAKYTEEGGRIWLSAWRQDRQALIEVRDNGLGIAPEMLPKVFDLFTQADRSLDRAQGGLGIGLTMVKSLAELHGGSVEARSEGPGKGSAFVVRLPASMTSAPAPQENTARVSPEPSGLAGCAGSPRRVLVVDDLADSAQSLAELLEIWGHQVRTVLDGAAALNVVREFKPELVLLDIRMPGMNGFEVARRLRAEHGQGLVLVALTGYGQEEDRRQAIESGFDHHLTKPVDLAALSELLTKVSACGRPPAFMA